MQKTSLCLLVVLLACADTPTELPDTSRDRIVFASNASGDYNIFAMDQDGSNRVQLTTMDTEDLNPAPSPDGTRIAFVSFDGALGGGDIYVMNADGTGVTQLTGLPGRFAGVATAPSWSPDRQKILFTGFLAEYPDLFVMSADGSGWTNLTHDNSVRDEYGAWSPDGRQIAFVRWIGVGAPAHPYIFLMSSDGGNIRQLTTGDVYDLWPAWSPDSRQIVFARWTARGASGRIYTVSAWGTGLRPLTDEQALDGQPSWSRDGKRLLFNSTRGGPGPQTDIWISQANGIQVNLTQTPLVNDVDQQWLPVP